MTASLEELERTDFVPFRNMKDAPWAMTAHIIYTALDAEHPATTSPKVIDYIRNTIGFSGVLVTDDLSMKALKGSFAERASHSLKAGCDLVLHCNGDMDEMKQVVSAVPAVSSETFERLLNARSMLSKKAVIDYKLLQEQLESAFAQHGVESCV